MKEPEKLIRKYYAEHNITHGAPLLFSYVRKSTTGGDWAVVEYYAAKYGRVRGKRGKDIVTKLVMKFNPDSERYSMSDSVIRYRTWSSMCQDHLIFDFHREMTGCIDYGKRILHGAETGGNRLYSRKDWTPEVMPTSEIPLNDFAGTKYQYCKYRYKPSRIAESNVHSYAYWGRNPYGNLPGYLRKFNLNPRAMEMFAARGLVKFMKDDFLIRLRDDRPFAKWYRKHALSTLDKSVWEIENMARREIGKTCFEICRTEERRLAKIRENRQEYLRKLAAERKAKKERETRNERIRALFEKLKSICKKYGAYEVVVPKSEQEMQHEGKRMHNCIGHVFPERQGINAICVFLHRNGKPCVDVEVNPETFEVVQCRTVCNGSASERQWKLARELASRIKNIYRKAA